MDFLSLSSDLAVPNINFNNNVRLSKRFLFFLDCCHKHFGKSIFKMCGDRHSAKAIYRMLVNDDFSFSSIISAHRKSVLDSIVSNSSAIILVAHDTTSINYQGHRKTEGLGYCYGGDLTKGLSVHSALALTTDGIAIGLLNQLSSTRIDDKSNLSSREKYLFEKKREKLPFDQKESYRWWESIRDSQEVIPDNIKAIHICDREADIYELIDYMNRSQISYIIRASYNRQDIDNNQIFTKVKTLEASGIIKTTLPRNSRDNIPARNVELEVRYIKNAIKRPWIKNSHDLSQSTNITLVHVIEKEKPKKGGKVEWYLLTDQPVNNSTEAFMIVKYYMHRWKIERFHYALKSGCNVEKLELRSVDKLKYMVFILSIVAVKILNITYAGRADPDRTCDFALDKEEWQVLYCAINKTKKRPEIPYTIETALKYLGELSGGKRAPSDGLPGLELVWEGMLALQILVKHGNY